MDRCGVNRHKRGDGGEHLKQGSGFRFEGIGLRGLFNIVGDQLKKLLNFDVSDVWCLDGSINSQECQSFEIDAVTIKKPVTEYHHLLNSQAYLLF